MDLELEKTFLEWQKEEREYMQLRHQQSKMHKNTESDLVMLVCFLMAWVYCHKTCDMKNISNIDFSIKLVITFMQLIYLVHLILVFNSNIN